MLKPTENIKPTPEAEKDKLYREFDPLVPELPLHPRIKAVRELIKATLHAGGIMKSYIKDKFHPKNSKKLEFTNHEAGHLLIGAMKDSVPIRNAWVGQNLRTTSVAGLPGGGVTNGSISKLSILKQSKAAGAIKDIFKPEDPFENIEPNSLNDEQIVDNMLLYLAGHVTAKGLQDIDKEDKEPMKEMFFFRSKS